MEKIQARTGQRKKTEHAGRVRTTGRPTVTIRGQVASPPRTRPVSGSRRRARNKRAMPSDRFAHSPDRIAMWAVLLGFFLVVVAATSSQAAGF